VIARGALAGYVGMGAIAGIVGLIGQLQDGGGGEKPKAWKDAQPPAEFAHRVITASRSARSRSSAHPCSTT
jgi:hypothetical protein